MRLKLFLLVILVLFVAASSMADTEAESKKDAKAEAEILAKITKSTLTKVGQVAPDFTLTTLDGKSFKLSDQRGKLVLVNFFATWCGPCKQEMPHLQRDIWEKHKDDGLVVLCVSREETLEKVIAFKNKHSLTVPFAVDADRVAYSGYASGYIPRNYLIGRDGKILYQSVSFVEAEFELLKEMIAVELVK